MKIRILFILLLAMFLPVFPQPVIQQFYYSELNVTSNNDEASIYFAFRVPYNRLVFEKEGEQYFAEYMLATEVFDSNSSFVARRIINNKVSCSIFEETNSNTLFSEGVMTFELPNGEYNFLPIFTDLRSNKETRPVPIVINARNDKKFLPPIIIDSEKKNCSGTDMYRITNFSGAVPFSELGYSIIIPAEDSIESIFVIIKSGQDTVYKREVTESFESSFNIVLCDNNLVVSDSLTEDKKRFFVVKDFSSRVKEGVFTVIVSRAEGEKPAETFLKEVKWFNKPFSLRNPEEAIRLLRFVEEERTVKDLLNSADYDSALFLYWKKYDPTPNTMYNPLMFEFYARADFASRSFGSLNGKNGVETDRGKVFLQFGKPKKVERSSNEYGKIIETWYYENPQRIFSFIDERGTGEFSLKNG